MGTILVSVLVDEARKESFDETDDPRHSNDDYVKFFNRSQRQLAIVKPDVSADNYAVRLVAGTKQTVPTGCTQFLRATRNMGTDGNTPGRVIDFEDFDAFSRRNPYWHAADASAQVRWVMFKPDDPKHYYNYPPQPDSGQGYIEGVWPVAPVDITAITAALPLDDIYYNVLLDLVLHFLFRDDAAINPYAGPKSVTHWNNAMTAVGRMDLLKKESSPKKADDNGGGSNAG